MERHRQHEADEEEENRRGDGDGGVHEIVAGPAHLSIDPPARRVVDDHHDERHAPHDVEERESRAIRHSGPNYSPPGLIAWIDHDLRAATEPAEVATNASRAG